MTHPQRRPHLQQHKKTAHNTKWIHTCKLHPLASILNPLVRALFLTMPPPLPHNTALSLSQVQDPNTQCNHKRQRSEVLSWKYEDVFLALDQPRPSARLSDPATGKLLGPASPDSVEVAEHTLSEVLSRAVTFAAGAGRRSGMVFSKGQMEMSRAIREGTPRTSRDEEEDETPTSMSNKR